MTKETVITLEDWEREALRKGITVMEDIMANLSEDYLADNFPIMQYEFVEVIEFFERIKDRGYFKEVK